MMSYPADLKYAESHEWVRIDGDVATVGISWFAQDSMGDVVHVELAEVGDAVSKGSPACEIESVKAVSDVYAPVSGEVVEINEALEDAPETVNEDPYGGGWLFKVRISGAPDGMMDAAAYQAHCEA
jgi:glycine cleavage system H protein